MATESAFVESATDQFIEFKLTRHAHMSESATCPYTVTVMFKDPPRHLVPHAWAILRLVCRGKELFSASKELFHEAPGSASAEPEEEEPSSASQHSNSKIMYGGSRSPKTRFRYKDPNTKTATL